MFGISYGTAKENDLIFFPHHKDPVTLFYMESGKDLLFHDSYYSTSCRIKCEAFPGDPAHFKFGHAVYHVNQFAENMQHNGNTYEPAEPIQGFELFEKKYMDRDLKGKDGKPIPYRMIWYNNDVFMRGDSWFSRQMPPEDRRAICFCPEAAPDRRACVINGNFEKTFLSVGDLRDQIISGPDPALHEMKSYEKRQVLSSALQVQLQTNKSVAKSEISAWKLCCPHGMTIKDYLGVEIIKRRAPKSLDSVIQDASHRASDAVKSPGNERSMLVNDR